MKYKIRIADIVNAFELGLIDREQTESKLFDLLVVVGQSEQLKDKKVKDLLNQVKSDIRQEENPKLGKTSTPYRREKLRFLYKIEDILSL